METVQDKEQKKAQMTKLVKFGVIGFFAAVLAPVAWMAVTGIAGMMVAFGLAIVGINLGPVVALKATNMRYRALDAERVSHIEKVVEAASVNPIETAVTQSQAFKDRGVKQLEAITTYATEVNNFETMTGGFAKKYPEAADRYKQQLEVMKKALKFKQEKYSELQQNIKLMDEQIDFLRANWKMSQALQRANALAGVDTEDPLAQLKTDSAIDAVVNSINRAFAEMDSSVLADTAQAGRGTITARAELVNQTPGLQSIEHNPQPALELDMSAQKQTVKGI